MQLTWVEVCESLVVIRKDIQNFKGYCAL